MLSYSIDLSISYDIVSKNVTILGYLFQTHAHRTGEN
jgi:hypothetical protein